VLTLQDEKKMTLIADTLYKCSHFGDAATTDMVRKELANYSDYDIHQLCHTYTSKELIAVNCTLSITPPTS
jgi:hypothetical protein